MTLKPARQIEALFQVSSTAPSAVNTCCGLSSRSTFHARQNYYTALRDKGNDCPHCTVLPATTDLLPRDLNLTPLHPTADHPVPTFAGPNQAQGKLHPLGQLACWSKLTAGPSRCSHRIESPRPQPQHVQQP